MSSAEYSKVVWIYVENEGESVIKENNRSDFKGLRLRERPRTEWMDCMKRALNEREISVEQGRIIVCDYSEWRAVVNA